MYENEFAQFDLLQTRSSPGATICAACIVRQISAPYVVFSEARQCFCDVGRQSPRRRSFVYEPLGFTSGKMTQVPQQATRVEPYLHSDIRSNLRQKKSRKGNVFSSAVTVSHWLSVLTDGAGESDVGVHLLLDLQSDGHPERLLPAARSVPPLDPTEQEIPTLIKFYQKFYQNCFHFLWTSSDD